MITRNAIGRPRYRCPQCERVVARPAPKPWEPVLHPQTGMSSAELEWPAPEDTPAPNVIARPRLPKAAVTQCRKCGAPLVQKPGVGRPRLQCADVRTCTARVRVMQRPGSRIS
ncbi:MAG: hypothetical protein ACYC0B_01960 [Gemmatimonadaceae bacterium]